MAQNDSLGAVSNNWCLRIEKARPDETGKDTVSDYFILCFVKLLCRVNDSLVLIVYLCQFAERHLSD